MKTTCDQCHGEGKLSCSRCDGVGDLPTSWNTTATNMTLYGRKCPCCIKGDVTCDNCKGEGTVEVEPGDCGYDVKGEAA